MDPIPILTWLFAISGWLLDWLSTVWPNDRFVEGNPFVVRYFGEQPDPLRFGLAKVGTLVVFAGLSLCLDWLLRSEPTLPRTVSGVSVGLVVPAFVGMVGWGATVHNIRVRRRL
jgi:hypothetical protein